jgi:hypothetical protein
MLLKELKTFAGTPGNPGLRALFAHVHGRFVGALQASGASNPKRVLRESSVP